MLTDQILPPFRPFAPPTTEGELRNRGVGQVPIPGTKCATLKSFVWCNRRWRTLYGTFVNRPVAETFHEFLIWLLVTRLGEDSVQEQSVLPLDQRHIVAKWLEDFKRHGVHVRMTERLWRRYCLANY